MTNQTKMLSPKEVAGQLGCHVDFILSEIRVRHITPVLIVNKRVIRIPVTTIEAYKKKLTH